ncbi:hypothetical protein D3C87_2180600 [compost metagenome]
MPLVIATERDNEPANAGIEADLSLMSPHILEGKGHAGQIGLKSQSLGQCRLVEISLLNE